eukprot:m.246155 g.246155  ORF g.246155 m.246155 type:complete len:2655 (+) comp40258_c0_seq14:80-8044(+)
MSDSRKIADHPDLFALIEDNNSRLLASYLSRYTVDCNALERDGKRLIHVAAELDDSECLRVLLNAQADSKAVTSEEHDLNTPLHCAAANGASLCLKLLLDHDRGATMNAKNLHGKRPLDLAVSSGKVHCIHYLTEICQETKLRKVKVARLKEDLASAKSESVVKSILKKHSDDPFIVTDALRDGELLFQACHDGSLHVAHVFLQHGANPRTETPSCDGTTLATTALHAVCEIPNKKSARESIAEDLLLFHPDLLDAADSAGARPLHVASAAGNASIVVFLLHCYRAVFCCHLGVVSTTVSKSHVEIAGGYLEKNGTGCPDVNDPKRDGGDTSLHLAASRGHSDVVEAMLKFSREVTTGMSDKDAFDQLVFDLCMPNVCGFTPLHLAIDGEFVRVVELLLDYQNDGGSSVGVSGGCDIKCNTPVKPLVMAVKKKNLAIIEAFLKHKTCCDLTDALQLVLESQQDLATLFLQKQVEVQAAIGITDPVDGSSEGKIDWHGLGLTHLKPCFLDGAADAIIKSRSSSVLQSPDRYHLITEVDLSSNKLTSLLFEVFQMSGLKRLNLAHNQLTELFDSDAVLPLSGPLPTVYEMPETGSALLGCLQLETLRVDENRLKKLPEQLFDLPALKILKATKNEIEFLPENFWTAPALTTASFAGNKLTRLPGPSGDYDTSSVSSSSPVRNERNIWARLRPGPCVSYKDSPSLRVMKSARLQEVLQEDGSEPADSDVLIVESRTVFTSGEFPRRLSKQDSGSREIHKVQRADGNHGSLMVQHEHKIEKLPGKPLFTGVVDEAQPENAKVVYSYLASSISVDETDESDQFNGGRQDSSLHALDVSHNPIKSLPIGFPCLAPNLKKLSIHDCELKVLDPTAMLPPSLVTLDAAHNAIQTVTCRLEVPRRCPRLPSNTSLANPPLVCRHHHYDSLPHLAQLSLNNNRLTAFELLQISDVEDDSLSDAKPEPFVLYPELKSLDLKGNYLRSFPIGVGKLSLLQMLDVSDNAEIATLPNEIVSLKDLWKLDLKGINLVDIGDDVIKQGAKQILNFMKHRMNGAQPYRRLKLMMVGLANKGKTTLVEHLVSAEQMKGLAWFKGSKRKSPPSTVGIDISEWVCRRGKGLRSPIIFSLWDFAGQEEYYATHQCFLSRRSLYLVLWNLRDGVQGVRELSGWLSNIQARAPGCPVIIVGTHLDVVYNTFGMERTNQYLQTMRKEITMRYIDTRSFANFPEIAAIVEVALVDKQDNLESLRNKIVKVALNMHDVCMTDSGSEHSLRKSDKRHCPLLEQKIPQTYLDLGDFVADVKGQWKKEQKSPVLTLEEFQKALEQQRPKLWASFRYLDELKHASQFLHNNGVLLNYGDSSLRNLYFVDPQWLCKMLAKVVAVDQVNTFAKDGLMNVSDLVHLFKGRDFPSHLLDQYISLLEKFEVALRLDNRLLIPSMLPTTKKPGIRLNSVNSTTDEEKDEKAAVEPSDVEITFDPSKLEPSAETPTETDSVSASLTSTRSRFFTPPASTPTRTKTAPAQKSRSSHVEAYGQEMADEILKAELKRMYVAPFHPSGFWPRLISRLLADQSIYRFITSVLEECSVLLSEKQIQWKCWRNSVQLELCGFPIMSVAEFDLSGLTRRPRSCTTSSVHDFDAHFEELSWTPDNVLSCIKLDGKEELVSTLGTCCLQVAVHPVVLEEISRERGESLLVQALTESKTVTGQPGIRMRPSSLFLKRLASVPYARAGSEEPPPRRGLNPSDAPRPVVRGALNRLRSHRVSVGREKTKTANLIHLSAFMLAKAAYHIDSLLEDWYDGLKNDQAVRSDESLVKRIIPCPQCWTEFELEKESETADVLKNIDILANVNSVSSSVPCRPTEVPGKRKRKIERENSCDAYEVDFLSFSSCQAHAFGDASKPQCSRHGTISVDILAPDVTFRDLTRQRILSDSAVTRGNELGHGGYGTVYAGRLASQRFDTKVADVAIKSFDRVLHFHLGLTAREKAAMLYKTARREVAAMANLDHPNVLPLTGLCLKPLYLVSPRAPQGDLESVLEKYRHSKAQIQPEPLRAALLEIARGMQYIHEQNVVYRDLKPSNVLVWSFPPPNARRFVAVRLKIADYGISVFSSSFGVKKNIGTARYVAPEIFEFGGREAYTNKVDVFAYGLTICYLLTLLKPFHNVSTNIGERYLNGERPVIPSKDFRNFILIHLLMEWCWAQDPVCRPDFGAVVDLLRDQLFLKLIRRTLVIRNIGITAACPVVACKPDEDFVANSTYEVWMGTNQGQLIAVRFTDKDTVVDVIASFPSRILSICAVRDTVWIGTEHSGLCIFSAFDRSELQSWPVYTQDDLSCSLPLSSKLTPTPTSSKSTVSGAETSILYAPERNRVMVTKSDGSIAQFKDSVRQLSLTLESSSVDSVSPLSVSPLSGIPIRLSLIQECRLPSGSTAYCAVNVCLTGTSSELWLGLDSSRLGVLDSKALSYGNVKICRVLQGPAVDEQPAPRVKCLVSGGRGLRGNGAFVWNSVDGSAVVVQWDGRSQSMVDSVDLYKTCLCEKTDKRDSRVTCLLQGSDRLFAGTASGYVVGLSWIPEMSVSLCVRPHSGPVRCLLPFFPSDSSLLESEKKRKSTVPALFSEPVVSGRNSVVLSCGLGLIGVRSISEVLKRNGVIPARPFPSESEGFLLAWLADDDR